MTAHPPRPASSTSPWSWALVIYFVFALVVFCFPGGLVDWLDERNASGWLTAPLAIAQGIDAASAAVGVKGVGQELHKWFAQAVGESDT
ncbi:MAG: hypothetical protein ACLPGW_04065 [Roseiarcus sp.]